MTTYINEMNSLKVKSFNTESLGVEHMLKQRERLAKVQGATFTIMVVGESGLGKSSFIRALFGPEFTCRRNATAKNHYDHCDIHTVAEIEVEHAHVVEGAFETDLTVVFTPKFGDYTDNTNSWVPITSYIDAQHQYYMCQEEQPDRTQITDTRVHVCFYFLPPTGKISELDLVAMRELSSRVNLIPVIAKSDSVTREDLQEFKKHIRSVIHEHGIDLWRPLGCWKTIDVVNESSQNEDSKTRDHIWPLAIVSSDHQIELPDGRKSLGRKYRWGQVDIYNPEHSDFTKLRSMVFGKYMLDLIDSTTYHHYKRQKRNLRMLRLKYALSGKNTASGSDFGEFAGNSVLAPEDCDTISYARTLDAESPRFSQDVAEEAASSLSALQLLLTISKYGSSFLKQGRQENDIVFRQRAFALKAQFDIVVKFQEQKFEQQASDLERKKDELSREIGQMNEFNVELSDHIQELERSKRN